MEPSTPGEKRRASSFSSAYFSAFLRKTAEGLHAFRASPRWVRWGGISLVLAGLTGLALSCSALYLTVTSPSAGYDPNEFEQTIAILTGVLWTLPGVFLLFGFAGGYALVGGAGGRVRGLVVVGLFLLFIPVALWFSYLLREWFVGLPDPFYSPSIFNSEAFFVILNWSAPVGALLVCMAVWRTRGLGRFSAIAPIAGTMNLPIWSALIFRIVYGQQTPGIEPDTMTSVVVLLPLLLTNLGWIFIGTVMFGAVEREARTTARKKQETEAKNLALASRLYTEAWRDRNLSVVDEIASEDFFDARRDREDTTAMKAAISDLHHAFPNLEVRVTKQTAERDRVLTEITFSGKDEGGVLYFPPTNRTATFAGTFDDRFGDGKLVVHDGKVDEVSLMRQLGLSEF